VFGRRRGARDRDLEAAADLTAEADTVAADDELAVDERDDSEPAGAAGPWDAAEPYSEVQRVDFGSLQVPVLPDMDIQLIFAEQQGACVIVHHQGSELQLMAFAAPKRDSLWDNVRADIAAQISAGGSATAERTGPFGTELLARVPAAQGQPQSVQAVRFTGVDGPRWFLRGLFSGPAAEDPAAAAPLEDLMREVVVVRGEHPVPPGELLEIRLPPDAAKALAEEQARAEQEGRFATPPNPFERGPETTETR
jgi:Protein of unknown function (DUF3710)